MNVHDPNPELTPLDLEHLLATVRAGAVAPQTAVQLLVVNGHEREQANAMVRQAVNGHESDAGAAA